MFVQVIIASAIVVLVSFLLIGINIIFFRKKFPVTSIGHNKNMKNLGIKCVKCEERNNYQVQKNKFRINPDELKIISE